MYFKARRSESTLSTDPGSALPPDSTDDHQDHGGDRLYRVVRAVASPLYRVGCRVRTEGLDNVPIDGPVILAANHMSFFDSVVLTLSVPRRTRFVGKAEYLESWTTRFLFPALGMIPIRRSAGREALAALDTAAAALEHGDMLGIYPEGTRSRDGLLHRGRTGVAQLALMTNAMIVPIGLVGTERVQPIGAKMPRPFHPVVARFGQPIDPSTYVGTQRRRRRQIRDDLMEAIRGLSGQNVSSRNGPVQSTAPSHDSSAWRASAGALVELPSSTRNGSMAINTHIGVDRTARPGWAIPFAANDPSTARDDCAAGAAGRDDPPIDNPPLMQDRPAQICPSPAPQNLAT